jgi:thermitase
LNSHKMRAAMAVLILLALVVGIGWPASAGVVNPPPSVAGTDLSPEFKAGELLVKFGSEVSAASARTTIQGYEAEYVETLYGSEVELWRVPEGSELQIMGRLNAETFVEYAEPNYRVYASDNVPNDPSFNKQWAHTIIESPAAWDLTTGSTGVTIAILDTGIDPSHPDLTGKIVPGYDFVDNDNNPRDENGHGTHVAGIAAAVTDNGVGVAGLDWQARIMSVRVLDYEGYGNVSDVVSGIGWAKDHGAKVLNLSLYWDDPAFSAQDAINQAHSSGCLVVAAMGNGYDDTPLYPAAHNNVLAVAATGPTDSWAPYSSYGNHCDVAAPGGEANYDPRGIYSTMPTYPVYMTTHEYFYNNYDYVQGTSMAAPHVSGLAALLWAVAPAFSPGEVQTAIETTAVDKGTVGWDPYYGHGRIDALAAVCVPCSPEAPTLHPIDNADEDGMYLVDWSDEGCAPTYTLQEDVFLSFPSPTTRDDLPNSQFQIANQDTGIWYYRVRASNRCGHGPWSDVQSVRVRPLSPSLEPIGNPGNEDEYELIWSTVPGASGYTLEEDDDPSFSDSVVRYKGRSTQYNVTGQRGGLWHYRVIAYNHVGDSQPSNTVSTMVDDPALDPPHLEPILNDDRNGDYRVDWQAVSGATSYLLEESRSPYFVAPTVAYSGPETQYEVVGQPGDTWHYRVRAFGTGVRSPWSNVEWTVVPSWVFCPLIAKGYEIPGIKNGGFEAGLTAWEEYSSHDFEVIVNTDSYPLLTPHSGRWLAWLGRNVNEVASIEQEMVVPTGAPHLHYWHWIWSEDACGFDFASVWVNDVMVETYALCASQNTDGYAEHVVDLTAYAGQRIRLRIRVETDSDFNSNLYIDDVSFQVDASADPSVRQGTSEPVTIRSLGGTEGSYGP